MSGRYKKDVERDIDRMRRILKRPRTLAELMRIADVSPRTVYRRFEELEQRGVPVLRVGRKRPSTYMIG
jgi:transcriptional regulator GlxA family with amidase domain